MALCAFVAALVAAPGAARGRDAAPCVGRVSSRSCRPAPPCRRRSVRRSLPRRPPARAHRRSTTRSTRRPRASAGGRCGCVRATAPGGTHAVSQRWSVLGAVSGDSLRADLVPAAATAPAGISARRSMRCASARARVDVVDRHDRRRLQLGHVDDRCAGDLPRLAPLRYWAAALELRAHARARRPARRDARADRLRGREPRAGQAAAAAAGDDHDGADDDDRADDDRPAPPPRRPRPTDDEAAVAKHAAEEARTKTKKTKKNARSDSRSRARRRSTAQLRLPGRGGADWGDSYGGVRSDVPGGWHHGDDLFAPLGTPVVAVADGTIFAVGWNRVGGWRLWLVDHCRQRLLLRAPLRVHDARAQQPLGPPRRRDRVRRKHGRRVHDAAAPALRGAPDRAALPRLRRRGRSHDLPALVVARRAASRSCRRSQLPDGAPPGFGSAADFRRLLAVHPRPRSRHPPAKAEPRERSVADTAGSHPRRLRAGRGSGAGAGSALPIVAGILLLAGGLAAVVHAARDGRPNGASVSPPRVPIFGPVSAASSTSCHLCDPWRSRVRRVRDRPQSTTRRTTSRNKTRSWARPCIAATNANGPSRHTVELIGISVAGAAGIMIVVSLASALLKTRKRQRWHAT